MRDLHYFGKALRYEPVNLSMLECVDAFNTGKSFSVILEPGDATRYEFRCCRVRKHDGTAEGILLTRVVPGTDEAIGSAIVTPASARALLAPLSNGNPWTMTVIDWWLEIFWQCLG